MKAVVFAIVPARNEERNIAEAVVSLDLQPELAEIIVVDDESSDGTAEILKELSKRVARLQAVEAGPLPMGWTGKNHACAVGADFALKEAGDARPASDVWLLFTDADTRHWPGSVGAALSIATRENVALVSFSPRQRMETFWERALIPIVYCRLARRFPFDRVNDPSQPDAAANGQYLLIRADAYEAIGRHAAVRNCVLEDVEIARRAKSAGCGTWFQSGEGLVETRMYRSFRELCEGWTKNLNLLVGGSLGKVLREEWRSYVLEFSLCGMILGIIGMARDLRFAGAVLAASLLIPMAMHAAYAFELRRNRYPMRLIQYYVPGELAFGCILFDSYWRSRFGGVRWKGRRYPAEMR